MAREMSRFFTFPTCGFFVYNGYWKEQAEEKIDLTQLLQTSFLCCVFDVRATAARLNVFKKRRGGDVHPRREFLFGLELTLSSAKHMAEIVREIRPYFLRIEPMGANPMLLQIANATIDLKTNRIRKSCTGDYLTKMPNVVAQDYAMEGSDSGEPIIERSHRERAYSFLWSIFQPCSIGVGRSYDFAEQIGVVGSVNFEFFPQLIARLLEGRPLRRTIYFPHP